MAGEQLEDERWNAHRDKHENENQALKAAVAGESLLRSEHRIAHEAAHDAHDAKHHAEKQAVDAAQRSMDKRLDQMNEFRDQLRDQASTFVRREAVEALDANMERRFEELRSLIATEREERRSNEGSRRGASASIGWIVAAISAVGAILGIIVIASNALLR